MFFPSQIVLAAVSAALVNAAALSTVTLDCELKLYTYKFPIHMLILWPDGTFTGLKNTTTGITYFRGVRYADPPVGDLRWRAAVSPPSTHLGHVNATTFGDACIATSQTAVTSSTSEDCLFGNVYVPISTTASSALPVLIYFHGGGFEIGSSDDYAPENLLQPSVEPLIFVTFNYRLGQFGFLGGTPLHDDGLLNAGLLDQKAALVWVQRYITHFGGDPRRVTIWGQSAGAGATMFHLISEGGANGNVLFHQAMESLGDSPSLSFLPHYNDIFTEDLFAQFAGFAGCSGTGSTIMACLRAAPTNTLALAGSQLLANRTSSIYPFAPIADGSFIHERPVEAFRSGNFARVPVLFGSNTNEGANWCQGLANSAANTANPNANETTVYNCIAGQFNTFTAASYQTALALYPLADYNNSFQLQGQQMYGEMRYICSALLITGAAHSFGIKAYQYHWDNPGTLTSNHVADLNAFFDGTKTFNTTDQAVIDAMRLYFTSFATSGAPVAANSVPWTPSADVNGSPRIFLHPGQVTMENITNALAARCEFWHGLSSEIDT
ncbi:alpha/beta-hydrolase [Mycena sanguinolenta]|nr:alpha/beta-hydrolase [Mycena sanguinolenta]